MPDLTVLILDVIIVNFFYFSIVENGQERVEVEEDGQLKSLTVNGKEQLLRLDNKWSLTSSDEHLKCTV